MQTDGESILRRAIWHVVNGNIDWVWRPEEELDATLETLQTALDSIRNDKVSMLSARSDTRKSYCSLTPPDFTKTIRK